MFPVVGVSPLALSGIEVRAFKAASYRRTPKRRRAAALQNLSNAQG